MVRVLQVGSSHVLAATLSDDAAMVQGVAFH